MRFMRISSSKRGYVQTSFFTATPRSIGAGRVNRTDETRLGENGGPSRGRASHPGVSAWGSPRRSPKTPRNGGKSAVGARSGRGFSGVADYLAERAVDRDALARA